MLLALAGGALPPEPPLDVPSLQARLVEHPGDDDARAALLQHVHARTLAARVAAVVAEDSVEVVLRDGSVLGRAEAERALALKEEARVYPPLRGPLLRARRQALDPVAARFAFDDVIAAVGLPPAPGLEDELAWLRAFLAGTADLAPAALEVLAGSAGGIDDAASLSRALDRPAGEQSGDVVAVDLVRVTRVALPRDARPLQRCAAPRGLAGHVVDDGEVVRVLWATSLRLGRQRALLEGVGRAFGHLADLVDLSAGLGLSLQAASVRQAAGASSSVAAGLWREAVASSLLQARLQASVTVGFLMAEVDPEAPLVERRAVRRDAAWRGARAAVVMDPGQDVSDELLLPPWPDGVIDRDASSSSLVQARARACGAADALTLRDIGDEGMLLRPQRLLAVREALQGRAGLTADVAVAGWRSLLGEVA